jgi:hypothetical protein
MAARPGVAAALAAKAVVISGQSSRGRDCARAWGPAQRSAARPQARVARGRTDVALSNARVLLCSCDFRSMHVRGGARAAAHFHLRYSHAWATWPRPRPNPTPQGRPQPLPCPLMPDPSTSPATCFDKGGDKHQLLGRLAVAHHDRRLGVEGALMVGLPRRRDAAGRSEMCARGSVGHVLARFAERAGVLKTERMRAGCGCGHHCHHVWCCRHSGLVPASVHAHLASARWGSSSRRSTGPASGGADSRNRRVF